MGQYWKPVIENSDGVRYSIESHDFDNGWKILEHSYIGNELPSIIMYKIYNKPMHVTWNGDYTDDRKVGKGVEGPIGHDLWKDKSVIYFTNRKSLPNYMIEFYNTEKDTRKTEEIPDDELERILSCFDKFSIQKYSLVNHTLKEYVDMAEYIKKPKAFNSRHQNYPDLIIHPLPLLVAAPSMDEGGGDYRKDYATCFDKVGSWSWDMISVMKTEDVPKDFKKLDIYFDELTD